MREFWEWLKRSLTVKGAVTAAVGLACDPNVLGLLPPSAARTVAIAGAACTVIGLRRALPFAPGGAVTPPSGPADETGLRPEERAAMDLAGREAFPRASGVGRPPQG